MPSDFAIHSDLLVHWTGGKDIDSECQPEWYEEPSCKIPESVDERYLCRLRDILEFGLWMTTQEGWELPGGVAVPPVAGLCFTELKLSQSRTHAMQYGRLGIAVKRPFLFERGGRPVVYFHPDRSLFNGKDAFLEGCSEELKDKSLLQFFKCMDSATCRGIEYDLYSESEWRILANTNQLPDSIVDPRKAGDTRIIEYFNSMPDRQRKQLQYLVPLDGWLAGIIYPSLRIKNKAQEEGSVIRRLIQKIPQLPGNARNVGEGLPIEIDLDLCRNL